MVIGLVVLALAACSSEKSVTDDLQAQKWNVVATNGETYTAEFGQDTVSFTMGFFSLGMLYSIDGDVINLTKEDDTYAYEIVKDGKEYKFTALNDETKDKFGDLTLSPAK